MFNSIFIVVYLSYGLRAKYFKSLICPRLIFNVIVDRLDFMTISNKPNYALHLSKQLF